MIDPAELANRFAYHKPTSDVVREQHELIRAICSEVAAGLNDMLPESREKSLALTSIQETMMWANAAVAIHQ
jgi:hypothetical protein